MSSTVVLQYVKFIFGDLTTRLNHEPCPALRRLLEVWSAGFEGGIPCFPTAQQAVGRPRWRARPRFFARPSLGSTLNEPVIQLQVTKSFLTRCCCGASVAFQPRLVPGDSVSRGPVEAI